MFRTNTRTFAWVACCLWAVAGVDAVSADDPESDHAWPKALESLSARLVVTKNSIQESQRFQVSLALKNTGTQPIAVQAHNPHLLTLKILDSSGKVVIPTSSRIDIISSPQWGVIPRDGCLSVPVTTRGPNRVTGSQIDIVTEIWSLPPGKYRVSGEYSSKNHQAFPGFLVKSGHNRIWEGMVKLPALDLEIRKNADE